jgi:hypothetical protein
MPPGELVGQSICRSGLFWTSDAAAAIAGEVHAARQILDPIPPRSEIHRHLSLLRGHRTLHWVRVGRVGGPLPDRKRASSDHRSSFDTPAPMIAPWISAPSFHACRHQKRCDAAEGRSRLKGSTDTKKSRCPPITASRTGPEAGTSITRGWTCRQTCHGRTARTHCLTRPTLPPIICVQMICPDPGPGGAGGGLVNLRKCGPHHR